MAACTLVNAANTSHTVAVLFWFFSYFVQAGKQELMQAIKNSKCNQILCTEVIAKHFLRLKQNIIESKLIYPFDEIDSTLAAVLVVLNGRF